MQTELFIVQPYVTKGRGLLAQSARFFPDAEDARRAGRSLARFRAGVVVLSQSWDPLTNRKGAPRALAIFGAVPEAWRPLAAAA